MKEVDNMNIRDGVKLIIKNERKTTQKDFAEAIGMPYSTYSTSLRLGNITINKLLKILNALDYEIVLRPKKGIDKSSRSIIIDETVERR